MSDTSTESATTPTATISRAAALSAVTAGGEAAREGKTIKDCPYPTVGGTTAERFVGNFWIKGFTAAQAGTK